VRHTASVSSNSAHLAFFTGFPLDGISGKELAEPLMLAKGGLFSEWETTAIYEGVKNRNSARSFLAFEVVSSVEAGGAGDEVVSAFVEAEQFMGGFGDADARAGGDDRECLRG
jgi:hypothetical protein